MIAGFARSGRKVRAPEDTAVGNAHRSQVPGQCNRKYTASELTFGGKGETAR
jgi:hypothetical protein